MKRSRPDCSSSGNIRVLNPPPAAASASAFRWDARATSSIISAYAPSPKVWEITRVGVLIVSAPDATVEIGQQQGEQESHFLDKCFFCNKGLRQIDERFIDFCAFCTPECRSKQIAVDKEKEKVSKQSTGTKTEFSRKNDLQYQPGAQPQKHAY
ncbi:uncharacterized protein LOC110414179 isoform X2 [Herrania umbratica]|uniref:Uncharacterized protein LOC110414179 isoform X2 n=1 Tax=Herrania umbratica TaxID=108875 RepID=A0A6J1A1S7_9ROSI|nr:uncharacterized protein LOC110414179 isoform X2 [Herrania umbratica]